MAVEREKSKVIKSFDELGVISDALVNLFTFRLDNKLVEPTLTTFQKAHVGNLSSVMKGYLRTPKRAPLPITGLTRGEVAPNMDRAASGRRVKVRDYTEDGAIIRVSGVIKPVTVGFTFTGLLGKMAQMDQLTSELMKMFHNRVRAFSVDIEEWGRMGCVLRMSGGISNETQTTETERIVGFSVPLTVETNIYHDIQSVRLATQFKVTTTPTEVWEGELS